MNSITMTPTQAREILTGFVGESGPVSIPHLYSDLGKSRREFTEEELPEDVHQQRLDAAEILAAEQATPLPKVTEIARFDGFIASLPTRSYLRPWLSSIRDRVASDIRTDRFPEMMPAEARSEAESILAAARSEAESILAAARNQAAREISDARTEAKRLTEIAEQESECTRQSLRDDVARLQRALSHI
jgi:hypothetical protein